MKKIKREKFIFARAIVCMRLPLYVELVRVNVCKLLCNRGLFLICSTQANIKPEPEESWFNMRRNQEYNAMRGSYIMQLYVLIKKKRSWCRIFKVRIQCSLISFFYIILV